MKQNRIISCVVLLFVLLLLAGCTPEDKPVMLPFEEPVEMLFSSGAGAWGTSLVLEPDGAFTGGFHDSNMGEQGDEYPNGTVYLCEFSGHFAGIEKLDEYRYRMTLDELVVEQPEQEEWIEDGIRYVDADAYGMTGGEEFILYLPETPVAELDEMFLNWWPLMYPEEMRPDTLSCYGLRNVATADGFFTYDFLDN